jgi:kynureninase
VANQFFNDKVNFENSIESAKSLDVNDPLKNFRERFMIPSINGKEQIYFLGNSLGLQSRNIKQEINKILDQWASFGVEGFFMGKERWLDYHDQLTKPLSKIIGAKPNEISVMNQLTVNLHLMMVSFYKPDGTRNKILCESKAFPSDQYMFETHIRYHGLDPDEVLIEVTPRKGDHLIRDEDILNAIDKHRDELAIVLFSGVNYYTGQVFDIRAITEAAHSIRAIAGFDLAHAAGNISLQLHDWNVDFACWCNYKYFNSGPGAMGGVFIHEKFHDDQNIKRFGGWWGYDKDTRFKMGKGFKPIPTAEGWQLSTPSMLLYASHKGALQIFEEAGWDNLRAKQRSLNKYLWFVLDELNSSPDKEAIEFITPKNKREISCQVSMLMLRRGREIFEELGRQGVMVDWREPNVIRIAPVPLYNTFEEIWRFGDIIRSILNQ